MPSTRKLVVLAITAVFGSLAFLWYLSSLPAGPPIASSGTEVSVPSGTPERLTTCPSDTERWVRHLVDGGDVSIVVAESNDEILRITPLPGKLNTESKNRLNSLFRGLIRSNETLLFNKKEPEKPPSSADLLSEAHLNLQMERSRCVLACIESGDYAIIPKGGMVVREIEDGVVVGGNRVVHLGQDAEVVFFLRYADWPVLARANEYAQDMSRFNIDSEIRRFNGLPPERRAELIEGHFGALEKLEQGPPAGLTREQVRAWKREITPHLLPRYMRAERGGTTVWLDTR